MTTLLEAADRLYGLPLSEFTPARDTLVKELRSSDRTLSEQVKGLKKPSTAAWVVNLLVRCDPDQVEQVITVGAALREAQASLDGAELRALTRQRRQLTAAITQQARALAVERGQKVTGSVAEQVEATLTSAMVDEAAGAVVRTGLLLTPLALTGVEDVDLAVHVALPDAVDFVPTPLTEPEQERQPPDLHLVPDPDEAEKKLAAAREELAEAERAADEASEALSRADSEVAELEAKSLQVQAEIDELRRRLQEHEDEQDEVDEQLSEAMALAESARDEVSVADAARAKAAAQLQSLS